MLFLRRTGRWLAAGLIGALAVNALAQPLDFCPMRAGESSGPAIEADGARRCHDDRAADARTAASADEDGEHDDHAGACTCCWAGMCGGGHAALNAPALASAGYDPGAGKAPRVPHTDAPRAVFHDPPLRPPAVTTL